MRRRFTISRLMIVVVVAAIDFLLAKGLARPGDVNGVVTFACVALYNAAVLMVIVTFRKVMRQKPGERASGLMATRLLLVMLLFPCLIGPLMILLSEILGITRRR